MADVEVSRTIAADAHEVWSMVSDITRMGEWSPEATGGRWLGDADGPAVGARFRGSNRNGLWRWSTTCRVVEVEPGASFVFDSSLGPLALARWGYRFEPTADGCRVTESWTDLRGAMAKLGGPVASGVRDRTAHNRDSMTTTLERLAAAAEARA